MSIPSPCIGYCQIDEHRDQCLGCARTREEVASWKHASAATREQVWAELPKRRAKLGIGLHRLGWTTAEIEQFVLDTFRADAGTWVFGVYGALAEFCIGPNDEVEVTRNATEITAVTKRAGVQILFSQEIRVLALETGAASSKTKTLVFAMPRTLFSQRSNACLSGLGADDNALRESAKREMLYDLGLGMASADFCVRTADPALLTALNCRIGATWQSVLAELGRQIVQISPTRVVRSPLGRIEVDVPIPLADGRSPDGPHTHFLPASLAANRETPPGMEMPDGLAPCAMFYPRTRPADECN